VVVDDSSTDGTAQVLDRLDFPYVIGDKTVTLAASVISLRPGRRTS
jgi:glycosyltransferase involved in cell wall biosynthesis